MPPLRFPTALPLIPGNQVAPELGNRLVPTEEGEDKAVLMGKGEGVTETQEMVEDACPLWELPGKRDEFANWSDGMSTKCASTGTPPLFDKGGYLCVLPVTRGHSRNTLHAALLTRQTRPDAPLPQSVDPGVA